MLVSIAEAILWGEQLVYTLPPAVVLVVSIAEAILWGEQHGGGVGIGDGSGCFNRRGDSLGGATRFPARASPGRRRFNRRGDSLGGATWVIHWAVTPVMFQSQRRFFGGSNTGNSKRGAYRFAFQSQRRFFGGSNSISGMS